LAGYDYIDFIHAKHAGWPGRDSSGRYGGLKPPALLRPIPDVGKRRITAAKFAIGAKLYHPSAFADLLNQTEYLPCVINQMSCDVAGLGRGVLNNAADHGQFLDPDRNEGDRAIYPRVHQNKNETV
jgi:hypothetical protein